MASSPHKIRFISIPGKETSPGFLMTREKFRREAEPRAGSSRDFRRGAGSAAGRRDRSANDCETPDVTLRIVAGI